MNITICGGGNLGHTVSGVLGSREGVNLSLLTGHPENWSEELRVYDPEGREYLCKFFKISKFAEDVIPSADMVILCLPGFAIKDSLTAVKPFLLPETPVGSIVSSTGFFFEAEKILPPEQPVFGFQRVPYISRVNVYGTSAALLGYKQFLNLAVENSPDREALRRIVEELFGTPTRLLQSHYEASLTNSNPLLHPSRLYTMLKDYDGSPLPRIPYFYAEWTVEASELLIAMDGEFQALLRKLPVREGSIPSILDYYESADAESLTRKIRSIEAFRDIKSPFRQAQGGFVPDFGSRYFTEDFPYGMRFIVECARERRSPIPIIEEVYAWGLSKCL